jgi:PPOX class probable F420-dependent enzyme
MIGGVMPRKMTQDEIRDFLASGTRTAKVATVARDGQPHVMPVWFVLDGDELVFTTGQDTLKARHLRRDSRIALCVEDDEPPFAFVSVRGQAKLIQEADDLLEWATRIAARYMGLDQAADYGRRNTAPTELLVRVTPERIVAEADVAGWDPR